MKSRITWMKGWPIIPMTAISSTMISLRWAMMSDKETMKMRSMRKPITITSSICRTVPTASMAPKRWRTTSTRHFLLTDDYNIMRIWTATMRRMRSTVPSSTVQLKSSSPPNLFTGPMRWCCCHRRSMNLPMANPWTLLRRTISIWLPPLKQMKSATATATTPFRIPSMPGASIWSPAIMPTIYAMIIAAPSMAIAWAASMWPIRSTRITGKNRQPAILNWTRSFPAKTKTNTP